MENSYFGISFLLVLLFNTTCVTALDGGAIAGISAGIVCIIILVVILIALFCYCHCAGGNPREACTTILNDNCCNRNSPPPAHQFPDLPPPYLLPPADSREPKQDTPGSRPGRSAPAPESHVQAKDDSAPSDGAEQDQPLLEHPQHRSSLPSSSTQEKPRTTRDPRIRGVLMSAIRRKEDEEPLLDEEDPDDKPVDFEEPVSEEEYMDEPAVSGSEEQPASNPEQSSDPVQQTPDESKDKDEDI